MEPFKSEKITTRISFFGERSVNFIAPSRQTLPLTSRRSATTRQWSPLPGTPTPPPLRGPTALTAPTSLPPLPAHPPPTRARLPPHSPPPATHPGARTTSWTLGGGGAEWGGGTCSFRGCRWCWGWLRPPGRMSRRRSSRPLHRSSASLLSSPLSLSSLELSETTIYEPEIRAHLGSAPHRC